MSSTRPTTKVILHHTWGKMANTGCLIVNKTKFSFSVCMQINHYHVQRQFDLICVGFTIRELITNDLIM